jgi:hypothetical protein
MTEASRIEPSAILTETLANFGANLMNIYQFWHTETAKSIYQEQEINIRVYGGSNQSIEDARQQALTKVRQIERKIAGDPRAFSEYRVDIREEIVKIITPQAIITRNRYGAQVLNVENMLIMDIDEPKLGFFDLFRGYDPNQNKSKIVEMLRKLAQKAPYRQWVYRIYETNKGIRVIVLGEVFDPKSPASQKIMLDFNCDPLYAHLCQKQACFRARLTPKPTRIEMKGRRTTFPFPRTSTEEQAFQEWLALYTKASQPFAVCRLLEQIGYGSLPETVQIHDQICGIHRNAPLA